MPLIMLLPNLLTVVAICAGLTAIRFGFNGEYEKAVKLVLVACVLDGLDGRLARLLKCTSQMGAELDSLADFVNFGVAPALMVYAWALQDMRSAGWIAVLIYAISCVIRLARFNVDSKSAVDTDKGDFFVGVPAPAGAFLLMFPMFVSFALSDVQVFAPEFICAHMVVVGMLMISRIPTYSFKRMRISRENIKFFILGFVALAAALLTYMWTTLVLLDLVYIVGVLLAWRGVEKRKVG